MKRLVMYILTAIAVVFCLGILVLAIQFWQGSRPIDSVGFDEFDGATEIRVRFANSPAVIRISDSAKVKLAREFIEQYPDGWRNPMVSPPPATLFFIDFFVEGIWVRGYGVGPASNDLDISFLVYNQTIKDITPDAREMLMKGLQVTGQR